MTFVSVGRLLDHERRSRDGTRFRRYANPLRRAYRPAALAATLACGILGIEANNRWVYSWLGVVRT
jgi:hypothetical protein